MTARVELSLNGRMDHLRLVWQAGEAVVEAVPFDDDPEGTRYNLLLAVQEMVTNVLRHAYRGGDGPVRVAFETDALGCRVHVWDRGPAFDPLAHEAARSGRGQEMPTDSGGFGILIATTVMDELAYVREGEWNHLTMFKSARAGMPVASN